MVVEVTGANNRPRAARRGPRVGIDRVPREVDDRAPRARSARRRPRRDRLRGRSRVDLVRGRRDNRQPRHVIDSACVAVGGASRPSPSPRRSPGCRCIGTPSRRPAPSRSSRRAAEDSSGPASVDVKSDAFSERATPPANSVNDDCRFGLPENGGSFVTVRVSVADALHGRVQRRRVDAAVGHAAVGRDRVAVGERVRNLLVRRRIGQRDEERERPARGARRLEIEQRRGGADRAAAIAGEERLVRARPVPGRRRRRRAHPLDRREADIRTSTKVMASPGSSTACTVTRIARRRAR